MPFWPYYAVFLLESTKLEPVLPVLCEFSNKRLFKMSL